MPLFPWALLITGGMLLLTLPILSGALLMILADLHSNTLFFDSIFGGDPIFYQHLFYYLVHKERMTDNQCLDQRSFNLWNQHVIINLLFPFPLRLLREYVQGFQLPGFLLLHLKALTI